VGVGLVVYEFKVFEFEGEDVFDFWVYFHLWEGEGLAAELFFGLV